MGQAEHQPGLGGHLHPRADQRDGLAAVVAPVVGNREGGEGRPSHPDHPGHGRPPFSSSASASNAGRALSSSWRAWALSPPRAALTASVRSLRIRSASRRPARLILTQAARRSSGSLVRSSSPAATSSPTTRDRSVGFSPSAAARSARRVGLVRATLSNTEILVGVNPAWRAAAVLRRRRDRRPMTVLSRAAVSTSRASEGVLVGVLISYLKYLLIGKH